MQSRTDRFSRSGSSFCSDTANPQKKISLFYLFRLFFWAFFGYAFFSVFAEDLQHEKLSGSVAGKSGTKRSDSQNAQDDTDPSGPRESENGQERKYDSQHNPHDLLGFYNIFLHPINLLHCNVGRNHLKNAKWSDLRVRLESQSSKYL